MTTDGRLDGVMGIRAPGAPGAAWGRLLPGLLLLSLCLTLAGVVHYSSALPFYWRPRVLVDFALWSLGGVVLAALLRRLAGRFALPGLVGCVLLYLVLGAGLAQSLAVGLFLVASWVLGRIVLERASRQASAGLLPDAALFVGLGLNLAFFGGLIHFPVNDRPLYCGVLALPLLAALRPAFRARYGVLWAEAWRDAREGLAQLPFRPAVAAVLVMGYVARFALFPSVGFDDNALHLRMWAELSHQHRYSFDVTGQIWAIAPFAVDLLHGIVSLVAAEDARSALNIALLLLLLRQLWVLGGLLNGGNGEGARLLGLVLFASTPIVANLLTTLQTELFLGLLAAAGVRVLLGRDDVPPGAQLLAVLAIAAMCCATKLPGAVLGVSLLAAYGFNGLRRAPFSDLRIGWLAVLVLLLAGVALHSYLAAWRLTGNPLFPLYNGIFKSPYFPPVNFSDARYIKGMNLENYWRIFFRTGEFFESKDFVAGFQYLLPLPLAIVSLCLTVSRRVAWGVLLPLAGFGLAMFAATQYWRYLFPVLPLAAVVLGSLATVGAEEGRQWLVKSVLCAFVAINLYFLPGVSWFFDEAPQQAFTAAGRQVLTERLAPAKLLTEYVSRDFPGERVLYDVDVPYGAALHGTPYYVTWYAPGRADRFNGWQGIADVGEFMRTEKIRFVVWDLAAPAQAVGARRLLRDHLARFGVPERRVGSTILYRLAERETLYRSVLQLASAGEPLLAAPQSRVISGFRLEGASVARYRVRFRCDAGAGSFIAQINWDVGAPYYRQVVCSSDPVDFVEAVPVPVGASTGEVYLGMNGDIKAQVSHLEIETN
ncbi:hypothetical protein [Zoogloea sp. LCSB751]|uniref:hypothetical protein n=1 Tax=Zoogloea sp. LCSB751 TaxID=1965277 RepID=UPI0009A4C15B|nr:hypothetical protein [Zoogloea sp. LCSB751]